MQDVCDLMWAAQRYTPGRSELSSPCSYSLADCIVNTALEKGSVDSVAAVVVTLVSTGFAESLLKERSVVERPLKLVECSGNVSAYDLKKMDHAHVANSKFERLLLDERADYMLQATDKHRSHLYDMPQVQSDTADQLYGGPLMLFHNLDLCMHLPMTGDNAKNQSTNSGVFSTSLPLFDSISFDKPGLNSEYSVPQRRYVLRKRFGRGSYGEVWLAYNPDYHQDSNASYSSPPDDSLFILKRIMVERGASVYLSGLREKHFGEFFLKASSCVEGMRRGFCEEGLKHIARYVESVESRVNEIWLAFHHEGISLSKLMYTVGDDTDVDEVEHFQILRPSQWLHWLKTTKEGQDQMRSLIWQLLTALKSCHDRKITHRDIKPGNIVICFEDKHSGKCLKEISLGEKVSFQMHIIDFGSAIDEFTLKNLYGSSGPSRDEQTNEYTPPEALLYADWYEGPTSTRLKYDMWSVGVVILELILESPEIFQVTDYTRTLIDQYLDGWNEDTKELVYKLRSLMELCILPPWQHHKVDQVGVALAPWRCSEEFFASYIRNRDPLKLGFPNVWAMRLVRGLLLWDPDERLSVDDALHHPYFQPPPVY